jgi:hypothetical protein
MVINKVIFSRLAQFVLWIGLSILWYYHPISRKHNYIIFIYPIIVGTVNILVREKYKDLAFLIGLCIAILITLFFAIYKI